MHDPTGWVQSCCADALDCGFERHQFVRAGVGVQVGPDTQERLFGSGLPQLVGVGDADRDEVTGKYGADLW